MSDLQKSMWAYIKENDENTKRKLSIELLEAKLNNVTCKNKIIEYENKIKILKSEMEQANKYLMELDEKITYIQDSESALDLELVQSIEWTNNIKIIEFLNNKSFNAIKNSLNT